MECTIPSHFIENKNWTFQVVHIEDRFIWLEANVLGS